MYLLPRALSAVTLGIVMATVHSDPYLTTEHDFLSALYLSSLDFSDVTPLTQRSLLMSHYHNNINSTDLVSKPRKKRTITLYPKGLSGDVEYRFNIPLVPVYNSTVLLLQIQSGFSGRADGVVDTGRSWDVLKPLIANVEAVASLLGLDGGACLRRAVCEVASAPSIRPHGFIGEVLQIFVRDLLKAEYRIKNLKKLDEDFENSLHGRYMEAGRFGRSKGDCKKAFPECNTSFVKGFMDI
ncbi:uncharacterized protein LOC122257819 [Penaeus japonicus]|uniref:uncharacterized protein LOC122257819 n=1 Tax=Penaeus japonicus TaxID=27405 RepID=UPI001C71495F|nr:uncharacterized protein LOC122257819 [Penaeus japonicus]